MRFGVLFGVVLAACTAVVMSRVTKTGHLVEDAETSAPVTTNVPQVVPQTTNASVPASIPTAVNRTTLPLSPKPNTSSAAANTTSAGNVSAAVNVSAAAPRSINASAAPANPIPVNASTATNLPTSMAVPNATNVSSTTVDPKSTTVPAAVNRTEPNVSMVSNVPAPMNVSTPTNVSQILSPITAPQAPAPNSSEPNPQQNINTTEVTAELMKTLDKLTRVYTTIPNTFGFLSDASEVTPEVQNPLEEFNMCTLSARIGGERGPLTVLVGAEDEERMRAAGSFYQLSNDFPDKHRTFTSYCSGKDNIYLTFNPKKRR